MNEINETNANKQCLEKILQRLTTLISLMELEDIKGLNKLVDMATSVSAQLLAVDEFEQTEIIERTEEIIETCE